MDNCYKTFTGQMALLSPKQQRQNTEEYFSSRLLKLNKCKVNDKLLTSFQLSASEALTY